MTFLEKLPVLLTAEFSLQPFQWIIKTNKQSACLCSLVYRVSSRTARAIQRNPVLKNKQTKKNKKQKQNKTNKKNKNKEKKRI
jgi:hypothetical protein